MLYEVITLITLWYKISSVWWIVAWYEDLQNGYELLKEKKYYEKIEKPEKEFIKNFIVKDLKS